MHRLRSTTNGYCCRLFKIKKSFKSNQLIRINPVTSQNLINLVNKLAIRSGVPLLVIDAKILARIHSNGKQRNEIDKDERPTQLSSQINNLFKSQTFSLRQSFKCDYFCSGQKVTHLATLQEITTFQDLSKFIEQLRAEQLTVLEFSEFDSSLLLQNVHLHLVNHLIIFRDQYSSKQNANLIHITIFQEKLNRFWISNAMHLTEFEKRLIHRQGVRKLHFQFSDHNHIYEK